MQPFGSPLDQPSPFQPCREDQPVLQSRALNWDTHNFTADIFLGLEYFDHLFHILYGYGVQSASPIETPYGSFTLSLSRGIVMALELAVDAASMSVFPFAATSPEARWVMW